MSGSPAISAMGRIVHRALARDPNDRYPTAEAMASELRATLLLEGIATAARAQPLRRLIVLPFRALSSGRTLRKRPRASFSSFMTTWCVA